MRGRGGALEQSSARSSSAIIDAAREHFPQPEGIRYATGARMIVFAIAVARTPSAPRPDPSATPAREPGRDAAE